MVGARKVWGKGKEVGNHIIVWKMKGPVAQRFVPYVWGNRFAAGFTILVRPGKYALSIQANWLYRPVAHKAYMDRQLEGVLRKAGITGTLAGVFREID